jgi:hypothetical protein
MTFGIKELKKTCNGEDTRRNAVPNGTRYFVIHDAFEDILRNKLQPKKTFIYKNVV